MPTEPTLSGKLKLAPILPEDISPICQADEQWLTRADPDFDVDTVAPWCLTEPSLMQFVRQRGEAEKGQGETWTYAVRLAQLVEDAGEKIEVEWAVGGFGYELFDDFYGVHWVAVHPRVDVEAVVTLVALFLQRKARQGGPRKEVRLWVRDQDDRAVRTLLPAWRRAGFSFKLVPDWFDGTDGWLGVWKKRVDAIDGRRVGC